MQHSSQLLKGVLDMCLLTLIDKQPSYGYELISMLNEHGFDFASDGSIYPVLSRLQKNGFAETYFVESTGGPARKYYRITDHGLDQLDSWQKEWWQMSTSVDTLLTIDQPPEPTTPATASTTTSTTADKNKT